VIFDKTHSFIKAGLLALGLLAAAALPAQTAVSQNEPGYVITDLDFQIKGVTQEFVLRQKVDIRIGRRFSSLSELEAYLAAKRQLLVNERVLASADVTYDLSQNAAGDYEVSVHFGVRDSWNIIALPKFQYDTNKGLLLSVRARDYNFIGSMQTLAVNFDYVRDQFDRHGLGASASFALPFRLDGLVLSPGVSETFTLYADGTPTQNASSFNLSIASQNPDVPFSGSVTQSVSNNPDSVSNDSDPYFLTSSAAINGSFTFAENYAGLGPLSYDPSITLSQMWRFDAPVRIDRRGLVVSFSHSISWGQADWVANTKRGLILSLSNTISQYLRDGSFLVSIDTSASYYLTVDGLFSLKTRAQGFWQPLGGQRLDMGGNLRGILDGRVDGIAGAFLNLDAPIKLFDFPAHLVLGVDWLDFELQLSPFLDVAFVQPFVYSTLGLDDLWVAGGGEILVYPLRMRSFIVRASLGFDLRNAIATRSLSQLTSDGNKPYEVYIGLGLLY
jgi:outer membrane protein assembly factor BamA